MIRKTTILFLALALLATVGAEESTTQEPTVVSKEKEKTPEPPKETEAPPAADAGSNSDAAAPEAPADGGNGTSSSAFMSYGLGASVVLLAAL